jgi:Ran GTPase-activating protein (RanGAP) involved in mRNA processing and transport
LKNVLVTGEFEGAKIVHIERLQVNVNHVREQSQVINVMDQYGATNLIGDLKNVDPVTREKLLKMIAGATKKNRGKA